MGRGRSKAGTATKSNASTTSTNELHIDKLNALNSINSDSSRRDIRSALGELDVGDTVYSFHENSGEIGGLTTIQKTGYDEYNVNGKNQDTSQVTKMIYNGPSRTYQSSAPDTSSHTKITGTKAQTVDGMKFKTGTYDVLKNMNNGIGRNAKIRKVEEHGKITTYNGVQYGVHKSGGQYYTTHMPTGMLIGNGQKTLSGVVEQIRSTHDRIQGTSNIDKAESKFKRTLRGD